VITVNYVNIFTHLNYNLEPSQQNNSMYSWTYFYLYGSNSIGLAPGSGPVQLPTQWVSAIFSTRKTSEHDTVRSAFPAPPPKTEVYHKASQDSWHVDKASLHFDIILLFPNLSLEIGLQPSHKLVCTSRQKDTNTHTHTHTHTHTQMCEQYVATAHTMESET